MNPLMQMLKALGPARLAMLGAVTAAMLGFFVYLITRISTPEMALLYQDLSTADSGAIVADLEAQGIPFEIKQNGGAVYVPRQQVDRLRVGLAQKNIPSGGSIGYEVFDQGGALGTTNFMQRVNFTRALEGELSRTISSIDKVASARVHLVLPERKLFSRSNRQPSASIVVKVRGGLGTSNVQAIQQLVAAAVPELNPENVSVVDDRGNALSRADKGSGSLSKSLSTVEEARIAEEDRIRDAIEQLLSRSVGIGNVRAEVRAEVDYNEITTHSQVFDPEGQVARSTVTRELSSSATDTDGTGNEVTVANNLPNSGASSASGATSTNNSSQVEETTNFEISRTEKTEVKRGGNIKKLSVAVLVNGRTTTDAEGVEQYEALTAEELEQLNRLARNAMGYDEGRGDTLEVINMRFVRFDATPEEEIDLFFGLTKPDIFKIAEMLVLGIVAILVVLLVLRPMVSKALAAGSAQQAAAEAAAQAALQAPSSQVLDDDGEDAGPELEQMIDLQKVEGQVKASSVKKITEIIESHPEEAVSIIRNWMYQDN